MRTILAIAILLGGIATAMLFRHNRPVADPPAPDGSERLVLRRQVGPTAQEPVTAAPTPAPAPADPAPTPVRRRPTPAILAPMQPGQPPPDLAHSYPRDQFTTDPRWGTAVGIGPPDARPPGLQQLHRIVDGDTLRSLAERYLGASDRADEIYQANRAMLTQPDLLPIGQDLKIPPATPRPAPSQAISAKPLSPIPPAQ